MMRRTRIGWMGWLCATLAVQTATAEDVAPAALSLPNADTVVFTGTGEAGPRHIRLRIGDFPPGHSR